MQPTPVYRFPARSRDGLADAAVDRKARSASRRRYGRWVGIAALLMAGCAAVAPRAADAQQGERVYRVGVLSFGSGPGWSTDALPERLQELGYVEGRNLHVEYRYAGNPESLPALAEELARLRLDVIVAGTDAAAWAVLGVTSRIPIVAASDDPVHTGLVKSLARPGGNVTGVSDASGELIAKRLQLLKEAAPGIGRVAGLRCPAGDRPDAQWRKATTAASALNLELVPVVVAGSDQIGGALDSVKRLRVDALLALDCRYLHSAASAVSTVPGMYYNRSHVEAGALMSYGRNEAEVFRVLAEYVAKVLKGAKPAELPIQQPTKFTLAVNMKTAKALGLTLPQSLLLQADDVIR